jgi:hypothetical protein
MKGMHAMPFNAMSFEHIKTISEKYCDVVVKESATGKLLFTSYGGRLLGMWPQAGGYNPLWVYEELEKSMSGGQWMTGGERLWIAPERSFFYENPRDFEGFHIPAGIDPGEYVSVAELTYENSFSLFDYSTNSAIDGSKFRRAFELIDDPYGIVESYAGVRISDAVSLPLESIDICAWSLAQIFTCGPERPATVLFPAKPGCQILSYFEKIPADRAEACEGYVRFKIDANAIYKLAVRPEDILFDNPCKALYITPAPEGDSWLCLIKRTGDMPRSQADCVDPARNNPEGPRGAIQSYNNGPGFEASKGAFPAFGEIELQLSKGVVRDGKTVSTATHELLAYEGSKENLLELAAKALNLSAAPELY